MSAVRRSGTSAVLAGGWIVVVIYRLGSESGNPRLGLASYGLLAVPVALAWLFLRMAGEGELRQRLLERGLDPRTVRRAVRYGRAKELGPPR